jgi:hypothetical protein
MHKILPGVNYDAGAEKRAIAAANSFLADAFAGK